jgi:site-specific recombinase XerD
LLPDLAPTVVSAFITESGETIDKRSVQSLCSILKVFFRYVYRVGLMTRDLSKAIESPRRYRFANLPRSISWSEVELMLQKVDRRNAVGRRDYAILVLLVTYGLRAREVEALTLDDIDWKRNRLHVGGRKAGHSTAYPLAPSVGEAILNYLKQGRPETTERAVFFGAYAPYKRLSRVAVSLRAKYYLRKAGINVSRPGSHTLRHACVQRLVDAGCCRRMPSGAFRPADPLFVWMIFWNSAAASIATSCVIGKPRKCNENIAACGKRTSPHDLGLQVNRASTYQHILQVYVR